MNIFFWIDGYLKNGHHQQNYPRPGSAGRRVAAGSEINVGPASAGYYKKHESSRKQVSRLLDYFISLVNFCSIFTKGVQAIRYKGGTTGKKNSLICMEGKLMNPRRENTFLFSSSQQLPSLVLGLLKGFLS